MSVQALPAPTTVFEVSALLSDVRGSTVVLEIVATLVISVSSGVPDVTLNVNEKTENELTGRVLIVQVMVPPDSEQLNVGPESCASETKVVFAGAVSDSVTACASSGPLFVTSILYVILLPAVTELVGPNFAIVRSARLLAGS